MSKIPTIAMIPSAYKANKVYSVLPTNGDADLDFARTSTRTRVNEIGLVEDLATGVPALDYSDGGCPSLLLEPQSTNLITYSEDFSDASWSKLSGATIVSNQLTSPEGVLNADLLQGNGVGGNSIYVTKNVSSGVSYILSCFAKKADYDLFNLHNFTQVGSVTFNLNNGTIETVSSGTFSEEKIEAYANGWYRCSVKFTASGTASNLIGFQNNTISGNLTYLWGAQLEQLSYATSYIPTGGATATRVAETLSKTGLSNYINSSEGVLYVEAKSENNNFFKQIQLDDGTADNRVYLYIYQDDLYARVVSSSSLILSLSTPIDNSIYNKFCVCWKLNEFKLYVNGSQISATINTGNTPLNLDELNFGNFNLTSPFYGKVKDLRVYNQALTDIELQNLTS